MELSNPITLKSGLKIKNRIAKSALSEQLSDQRHQPTDKINQLYGRWSQGGAGLLITGNVMLSPDMIGEPKNIVLNENSDLTLFKTWACAAQTNDCKCFLQLNHPGRQVPSILALTPKAPSAVPMQGSMRLAFNKPAELRDHEINDIIQRFARSAGLAKACGFAGVQIHGAHGYLVNQFLSPLQNRRTDKWGGSRDNRMRFVMEVYQAIRAEVGDTFPVAIKLSSSDAQAGGYTEEDALFVAKKLDEAGIDFIEVSGGNYESQAMMGDAESIRQGKGYFVEFATTLKHSINAPVMITGGLRNTVFMNSLLKDKKCDLIGMGRPFALTPDLPAQMLNGKIKGSIETPYIKTGIPMLDKVMLINITWYEQQLARIASGKPAKPKLSPWVSLMHTLSALGLKGVMPRRI